MNAKKWFNAEEAHREESHVFCSGSCSAAWTKRHTRIPTLARFLEQDFKPYVAAHFRHQAENRSVLRLRRFPLA
jgi:hypothetical protein